MDLDIHHIAKLASIRLTEDEAKELGPQLNSIIEYIESMAKLDTGDVLPTSHPHDASMPIRKDEVRNHNDRDALQKSAPHTASGLYVVPKVLDT